MDRWEKVERTKSRVTNGRVHLSGVGSRLASPDINIFQPIRGKHRRGGATRSPLTSGTFVFCFQRTHPASGRRRFRQQLAAFLAKNALARGRFTIIGDGVRRDQRKPCKKPFSVFPLDFSLLLELGWNFSATDCHV